jgi:hypothetical protein
VDDPGALRERHEHPGRHQVAVRAPPPHQGLDAAGARAGAIDKRLVEQEELVPFQGEQQGLLDLLGRPATAGAATACSAATCCNRLARAASVPLSAADRSFTRPSFGSSPRPFASSSIACATSATRLAPML